MTNRDAEAHPPATWPYPAWIAHRGAGRVAPENTLAAIGLGASLGFRMFEFDVRLCADRVPVLMHDATVERTTEGRGAVSALPLDALRALDAGRWHSERYAGERVPTLAEAAARLHALGACANIEIKPDRGHDAECGSVVAREAAALWAGAGIAPLLSSFSIDALRAARDAVPSLPRALLASAREMRGPAPGGLAGVLQAARALDAVAVVLDQRALDPDGIAAARLAGLRVLTYTLDDPRRAADLLAAGLDGVITDAVDRIRPG